MSEERNKAVENIGETVEEVKGQAAEAVEAVKDQAAEAAEAVTEEAKSEAVKTLEGLKAKAQALLDKTDVDEKVVEGAKGIIGKIKDFFKGN